LISVAGPGAAADGLAQDELAQRIGTGVGKGAIARADFKFLIG
jgi:hypothetical protein